MSGLGAIQREALIRLYASPDGLTAPQLADLSAGFTHGDRRSSALGALKKLRRRGLTATAGLVPRQGRGGQAYIWVLTEAGQKTAAELTP